MRWWRALDSPRGVFWSHVGAAVVMVAFGVLVLAHGDDQRVIGAAALLVAVVNAAMGVGAWWGLRASEGPADDRRQS
ncbi:hypothetical protein ACI784_17660 [Geodermatophilus sp. SYSU D01186]